MSSPKSSRINKIRASAEKMFGREVTEVSAPGGSSRSSLRFHFNDETIIGTLRPNFRRTHLEAFVLRRLEPFCDDIPRCMGVDGEVMFQSDVGNRRLNLELFKTKPEDRPALAAEAVAAIFRIQAAARKTDLHDILPHLGNNPQWISNVVRGTKALKTFGCTIPASFDKQAVMARLKHGGTQFVKWDCRSGNAALDEAGRLRWFDFEYAGLRHGAEDLSWFIADESIAIPAPVLWDITLDALPADLPGGREDYVDYLAVYTALHSLQRLQIIIDDSQERGWLKVTRILERDDAGIHPAMAAHLCRVGALCASKSRLTDMLVPLFETAAQQYDKVIEEARAKRAAEEQDSEQKNERRA